MISEETPRILEFPPIFLVFAYKKNKFIIDKKKN